MSPYVAVSEGKILESVCKHERLHLRREKHEMAVTSDTIDVAVYDSYDEKSIQAQQSDGGNPV